MKKSLLFWCFAGFVFTSVAGTLLHFVFDWSNQNIIVGLFSAVNESIWEHIKLFYFPAVLFFVIQNRFLKSPSLYCAQLSALLVGIVTIPSLYYTYTGASGVKADWFNILIFFIAAALSFYTLYKTVKNNRRCKISPIISYIIIFTIGFMFIIFTFVPPHIPLFIDPLDSTYGFFKTL